MSFNGTGTFLINTSGQPVQTGTTISSTAFNLLTSDLAGGLSNAICRDGQSTLTGNIPFGGYRVTGLGNAASASDAATLGQVQDGACVNLTNVTGSNTITATVSPAPAAVYATGAVYRFVAAARNTGPTTLNINGAGAKNVFSYTAPCIGGELLLGVAYPVYYDGTQFQLIQTALFPTNCLLIEDQTDRTRNVKFDLSALASPNVTRTISVPDGDLTLVGTTLAQTLSNKTYSGTASGLSFDVANNSLNAHPVNLPLTGDVIMTNTNTWYDVLSQSVGSTGTFLVIANACFADTVVSSGQSQMKARITDGTNIYSSVLGSIYVRGSIALGAIVTNPVGGTIKLQARCDTTAGRPVTFNQVGDSKDTVLSIVRIG